MRNPQSTKNVDRSKGKKVGGELPPKLPGLRHFLRSVASSQSQTALSAVGVQPWETVVTCYSAVDRFFPACGLFDLTEGIYHGNPNLPFEQAQANQHDYLLDQVRAGPGSRMLDIGCGYGTLLARAKRLGVAGVGITVTPEQVQRACRNGLDVHLLDYRAIPREWDGTFDGVIANGSIEHFVRPDEVADGRSDDVYRHLFATVHRLINPASPTRRFATTTIHLLRSPSDPRAVLKPPSSFHRGSDDYHWSVLEHGWGGYYPELGQLRRCAEGYFDLVEEVDGTEDYRLTSEEWLRWVRRALRSSRAVMIGFRSLPVFVRAPKQFLTLLRGFLSSESWNWQFRGPNPPTRLLRQTWQYRERA
ncbi:MAG: class I SAM-dependent methyltransferase [Sedimentisphaerales bacterium]|nr:class I SAM-dependent methyltransferase [Sedimentisphaerales bacterium]